MYDLVEVTQQKLGAEQGLDLSSVMYAPPGPGAADAPPSPGPPAPGREGWLDPKGTLRKPSGDPDSASDVLLSLSDLPICKMRMFLSHKVVWRLNESGGVGIPPA